MKPRSKLKIPESSMEVITIPSRFNSRVVDSDPGLVTGWEPLNDMIEGSFRKGTVVTIHANRHSYKSGFIRSLVCQLATKNVPFMNDGTKRPLIVFISFEDTANEFIKFMYRYLYFNENTVAPVMTNVNTSEATDYVNNILTSTGYHVKMLSVSTADWTYMNIVDQLTEYKAAGYEVHACVIDHPLLPTKVTINDVKSHFSNHNILLVAASQANSGSDDSSGMLEHTNYNPYHTELPEVKITLNKVTIGDKYHLEVGLREHPYNEQSFTLPFPDNAPIPETNDFH